MSLLQEALEWIRLAGERSESESEQWEIRRDVQDFEGRVSQEENHWITSNEHNSYCKPCSIFNTVQTMLELTCS